uniref:Uncharacterized protein n=1 Tax=Triticum urartu TaxID=4572 RepID=A0A8R7UNR6_TRIUA
MAWARPRDPIATVFGRYCPATLPASRPTPLAGETSLLRSPILSLSVCVCGRSDLPCSPFFSSMDRSRSFHGRPAISSVASSLPTSAPPAATTAPRLHASRVSPRTLDPDIPSLPCPPGLVFPLPRRHLLCIKPRRCAKFLSGRLCPASPSFTRP